MLQRKMVETLWGAVITVIAIVLCVGIDELTKGEK